MFAPPSLWSRFCAGRAGSPGCGRVKPPRGKSPTRQSCYGDGASWGILAKESKTPAPMDDQSIYIFVGRVPKSLQCQRTHHPWEEDSVGHWGKERL